MTAVGQHEAPDTAINKNELGPAGYSPAEMTILKAEVLHYTQARDEVRLASGDYIDLKMYEPAMRHLIDTYIQAEESEKISALDDLSLAPLLAKRGPSAVEAQPKRLRNHEDAVAETIENNVRKLIINESPVDPAYYAKMSTLLDALIEQRRQQALDYQQYLAQVAYLAQQVTNPRQQTACPPTLDAPARQTLYNNLDQDERLALTVDAAVRARLQKSWRDHPLKTKKVRLAIKAALAQFPPNTAQQNGDIQDESPRYQTTDLEALVDRILDLVKNQHDY